MKLWLDNVRPLPEEFDRRVATAAEAIALVRSGEVTHLSLKYDLGEGAGTGLDVVRWIERTARQGGLAPLVVRIHETEPAMLVRMSHAMARARHYWWTAEPVPGQEPVP